VSIISNNLDINGVDHLTIPKVLFHSSPWDVPRSAIKLDNNSVNTKSKIGKVELVQQSLGSFRHLLVSGHANELRLEETQLISYPVNGPPCSFLRYTAAQSCNTGEASSSIKVEGDTDLLNRRQWPATVV
jgi:hypothetical protein